MPRGDVQGRLFPILPVEVLNFILDSLNRYDIRSVILVNSVMAELARPFCYGFGLFHCLGIVFPLAPVSHPLIKTLDPRIPYLTTSQKERVFRHIKTLVIGLHEEDDCEPPCFPWPSFRGIQSLDVLQFHVGREDPFSPLHFGQSCGPHRCCPRLIVGHYTDVPTSCEFLNRALSRFKVHKLALRNFVICCINRGETPLLLPALRSAAECVSVLSPALPTLNVQREFDCLGDETLRPKVDAPQNTKHLTWIFLPQAGQAWVPECFRVFNSVEDPRESLSALDHICNFVTNVWDELARHAVNLPLESITVVNAATLPGRGETIGQRLAQMEAGTATDVSAQLFLADRCHRELARQTKLKKVNRDAVKQTESRIRNVRFVSLEEWIETSEWQDVFSPRELSLYYAGAEKAGLPVSETGRQMIRFATALGLYP